MYIYHRFILQSFVIDTDCFCLLTILLSAAMNRDVHVYFHLIFFPLGVNCGIFSFIRFCWGSSHVLGEKLIMHRLLFFIGLCAHHKIRLRAKYSAKTKFAQSTVQYVVEWQESKLKKNSALSWTQTFYFLAFYFPFSVDVIVIFSALKLWMPCSLTIVCFWWW